MSMQAYHLVFYPLPEKFWELLKPSYKKVLTSPVIELFVSLLTDKHQFISASQLLPWLPSRDAWWLAWGRRGGDGIPRGKVP